MQIAKPRPLTLSISLSLSFTPMHIRFQWTHLCGSVWRSVSSPWRVAVSGESLTRHQRGPVSCTPSSSAEHGKPSQITPPALMSFIFCFSFFTARPGLEIVKKDFSYHTSYLKLPALCCTCDEKSVNDVETENGLA